MPAEPETPAIGPAYEGLTSLTRNVRDFRFAERRSHDLRVWCADLGSVRIAAVRSAGYDIMAEEAARLTFVMPLHARVEVTLGSESLAARPGGWALLRPGARHSRLRAPDAWPLTCVGLVALRPAAPGRGLGRLAGLASGGASVAAGQALRDYLAFLVRQLARPDSPLHSPRAMGAAEALLLDLLAELDLFDAPAAIGEAVPGEARVRQAEEIMRAGLDLPVTVADLAREVGVGTRALQLAFRAHRGLPPRAVLLGFRLDHAREQLLAPPASVSVTEIALNSGFLHFGRFAAAYRARFGENPSETLRRARR